MITKDSKLYSVIHQTCPRCHEGKMFASSTYSRHFMKMNKTCSHCGLDFIQEPSYYFGAMYCSYAIQVVVFVMVYLILQFTNYLSDFTFIIWTVVAVCLILPFNYRVSRVMWINFFISYENTPKTLNK